MFPLRSTKFVVSCMCAVPFHSLHKDTSNTYWDFPDSKNTAKFDWHFLIIPQLTNKIKIDNVYELKLYSYESQVFKSPVSMTLRFVDLNHLRSLLSQKMLLQFTLSRSVTHSPDN